MQLADNCPSFGNWANIEQKLYGELDNILRRKDENEEPLPLDLNIIDKAYSWLITRLGIPQDLARQNQFAIKYGRRWLMDFMVAKRI